MQGSAGAYHCPGGRAAGGPPGGGIPESRESKTVMSHMSNQVNIHHVMHGKTLHHKALGQWRGACLRGVLLEELRREFAEQGASKCKGEGLNK